MPSLNASKIKQFNTTKPAQPTNVTVTITTKPPAGTNPVASGTKPVAGGGQTQVKKKIFKAYLNSTTLERGITNFINDELVRYFKFGIIDGIIVRTQDRITATFVPLFKYLNIYFAERIKKVLLPWKSIQAGGTSEVPKFGIYTGSLVSAIEPDFIHDVGSTQYAGSLIETRMKSDVTIKGIMAVKFNPTALRKEHSSIMPKKAAINSNQPVTDYADEYLRLYQHYNIEQNTPKITQAVQAWLDAFAQEVTKQNHDLQNNSPTLNALKQAIQKLRAEIQKMIKTAAINRKLAQAKANLQAKIHAQVVAQKKAQTATQLKAKAKAQIEHDRATAIGIPDPADVQQHLQKQRQSTIDPDFDTKAKAAGWSNKAIKNERAQGEQKAKDLGIDLEYDFTGWGGWRIPDKVLKQFQDKGFPSPGLLIEKDRIPIEDKAVILADPDTQWTAKFKLWLRSMFDTASTITRGDSISKLINGQVVTISQKQIDANKAIVNPQKGWSGFTPATWQDIQSWYKQVGFDISEAEARLIRLAVQSYTRGGDGIMRKLYFDWREYIKNPSKGFDLTKDRSDHPDNLDHTQENINLLKQYGRIAEFLRIAPHIDQQAGTNLYRGVHVDPTSTAFFPHMVTHLKVGSTFYAGPPGSWSTDYHTAANFSTGMDPNEKSYIFHFDVDSFVQTIPDAPTIKAMSYFPSEEEVLISVDEWEVLGITKKGSKTYEVHIKPKK